MTLKNVYIVPVVGLCYYGCMTPLNAQKKIISLESELEMLKRFVVKKPDVKTDDVNWKGVKRSVKSARKKVFDTTYGSR